MIELMSICRSRWRDSQQQQLGRVSFQRRDGSNYNRAQKIILVSEGGRSYLIRIESHARRDKGDSLGLSPGMMLLALTRGWREKENELPCK